jgi:hypothetical protein
MIDEALRLLKEHDQAPAGSTPKADAAARATAMQKPISGMATIRDKMGHWPPVPFRHDGEDWFAFCHLRALSRSEKGQWEAFWNRDFSCN